VPEAGGRRQVSRSVSRGLEREQRLDRPTWLEYDALQGKQGALKAKLKRTVGLLRSQVPLLQRAHFGLLDF
jgi:hypothetical protein